MPTRRERAGLGLAVTDDAGNEQVGVVVRRTVRMHECVPELTAFMDRAGSFRRDVARDPTGKRELAEELAQAFLVLTDVGVHLAVGSFEVRVGDETRTAVSRPRDVEHTQAALADRAIEMDVDEVEARGRSEVSEQTWLHVLRLERLTQQRIVQQVDLADREVVCRAPVGVEPIEAGICRHFTQFGEWATLGHCANAIPFRTGPATVSQDSGRAITPVAWELKRGRFRATDPV